MFKVSLRTITLLVITFLAAFLLGHMRLSSQERQPTYLRLPKAWGSIKAASGPLIILEDATGRIRIVELPAPVGDRRRDHYELLMEITRE